MIGVLGQDRLYGLCDPLCGDAIGPLHCLLVLHGHHLEQVPHALRRTVRWATVSAFICHGAYRTVQGTRPPRSTLIAMALTPSVVKGSLASW